ncbi:hypothetical protein OZX62_05025 [Bifidobacterium sp. ESL0690]|uniref:hypothetical protein n=1 Tax=Bifidobacterium sp. ESL0690 TaxID=2983214 RepID=UPI0023FA29A1|nr:hypothetical protein [Bifidobacterium sp. ESL0690]WEV47626.1 hypothetical protein OZX62_05025 [Bifidobacterium sp. ESL0690]
MQGNYTPIRRDPSPLKDVLNPQPDDKNANGVSERKVMLSLRVPAILKRRFKAEASAQGRRMEECLIEAIGGWLESQQS